MNDLCLPNPAGSERPADWAALKALFHQGNQGGADVQQRILAVCAPDTARLLQEMWADAGSELTQNGPVEPASMPVLSPAVRQRFDLVKPLGRGGMGRVFLARQREPIQRYVALKFLSPHLTAPRSLARFKSEADTTATLNHPAVVQVFDAVFTGTTQPFLVMEYVVGPTLDRYVDEHAVARDGRLALCAEALRGLAYAHRRGIVHRDVKPANLVVCLEDNRRQIKIIDFGISAVRSEWVAENQAGEGGYPATRFCGTPGFMSPEQMRGEAVDGRADIFSLGLVLLELLAGKNGRRLRLAELADQGVFGDAVGRLPDTVERADGTWRALLSEAESAVLEKATAADPAERYADADAMAADLQALREHRLVSLHAGSPKRRLGAWLRRHPARLAVTAAMIGVLWWGGTHISQVRTRLNEVQAESVARDMGLHRLSSQSQLLLAMINPAVQPATPETTANLYRIGRNLNETPLAPEIAVLLRLELGGALAYYSDVPAALREFRAADALLDQMADGFDEERIFTKGAVAFMLSRQQRFDQAEALYEAALPEARRRLGETHELALALAGGAALVQAQTGRFREALKRFQEVHHLQRRSLPVDSALLTATRSNYATLLAQTGQMDAAESLLTANLMVLRERYGATHPLTLRGEHNYLYMLYRQGRVADALAGLQHLLEQRRALLGDRHPDVTATAANVVGLLTASRRFQEAADLGSRTVAALDRETLNRPRMVSLQQNTAHAWLALGRPARAEAMLAGLSGPNQGGPLAAAVAFTRFEAQFEQGCRREALLGMRVLLRDLDRDRPPANVQQMRRAFDQLVQRAAEDGLVL